MIKKHYGKIAGIPIVQERVNKIKQQLENARQIQTEKAKVLDLGIKNARFNSLYNSRLSNFKN